MLWLDETHLKYVEIFFVQYFVSANTDYKDLAHRYDQVRIVLTLVEHPTRKLLRQLLQAKYLVSKTSQKSLISRCWV